MVYLCPLHGGISAVGGSVVWSSVYAYRTFAFSAILSGGAVKVPLSVALLCESALYSLSRTLVEVPSAHDYSVVEVFSLSYSKFSLRVTVVALCPYLHGVT